MKKFTVLVLVCAFVLSACLPAAAPINSAPTVDVAGTVNAIANIANTQTQAAQPSPTSTPVQITATATSGPVNPAATSTSITVPGLPSLTPTLGVLTYGTLPPANRPYVYITLINKAQRQAYISLQVVTDQGYTIIEYPVKGTVKVKIPTGSYTYVVWVGGRQIVGYFNVSKHDEPTLLIYKDKVIINKNTSSYP